MGPIYKLFYLSGSLVCHQEIPKTLKIANIPLPVCSRCTGIYTGFVFSFLYLFLIKKLTTGLNKKTLILFSFFILILFMDIGMSIFNLWTSPNYLRLLYGLYGATGIGFFLAQMLSFIQNDRFKMIERKDLIILLAFPVIISLLLIIPLDKTLYCFFWALLITFSIFLTYLIINITLVSIFLKRDINAYKIKASICVVLLLIFEFAALYFIHKGKF